MADDASRPKPQADTEAKPPRAKREARPRPDRDAFEAGKAFMDEHPKLMARLAE